MGQGTIAAGKFSTQLCNAACRPDARRYNMPIPRQTVRLERHAPQQRARLAVRNQFEAINSMESVK
jgi:hypothetical protein